MLQLAPAPPSSLLNRHPAVRRTKVRMVRPSPLDLRFKADAWVVDNEDGTASLRLGDYQLLCIGVLEADLASLNRTLYLLRQGQARRQFHRQQQGCGG